MKSKDLRQQRAKLVADARALETEFEKVASPSEGQRKEHNAAFDAIMAKADELKAQIDRIERLEDEEKALGERRDTRARREKRSPDEVAAEEEAESDAFRNFMRFGFANLDEEDRKLLAPRRVEIQNALSIGTGSAGGITIPQGFYDQLIDAEKAYGGMLNAATVINTDSGAALPVPTDNDTTNSGAILTENTQAASSGADPAFSSVTLNAYMYTSKIVLVSLQLLQDSAFNLDDWLSQKLGVRIGRATNTHFTVGTGSSQPNGVVTAATLGKTGLTGQTLSIIYDDLIDLEHSVDPAYRRNANFMMADSSLKVIKKLKDSQGRPLWLPGLAMKEPDTINGYPYMINQDTPVMAANAKSVLFGDFTNYFIRRVAGASLLRLSERYADFAQVGFVAFQRFDGNLIDAGTHPVAYYANSAT